MPVWPERYAAVRTPEGYANFAVTGQSASCPMMTFVFTAEYSARWAIAAASALLDLDHVDRPAATTMRVDCLVT